MNIKSNSDNLGMIVNIQDYSVHDGYGIRTLVFLKGCPLSCPWCQNPEAINPYYEIQYQPSRCIECDRCGKVCSVDAIAKEKNRRIDRNKCTLCMSCVDSCPSKALSRVGARMSIEEVMKPILSYRPFYESSEKGGVTFSGGDPLFQPKYLLELLKRCGNYGIHTAMETSGYTQYEVLGSMAEYLNLVLYDIKHMDNEIHKRFLGVSNHIILENLERLSKQKNIECVIRIPLIPGFNESEKNIKETSHFVSLLGIKRVDLLPFNELPSAKYKSLGREWQYKYYKRQPGEKLDILKKIAESYDLKVTIGGLW